MNLRNFALVAFAASALASHVRADDKPVSFLRTYKEGTVTTFKVVINASVMGMDIVVKTGQKVTVKSVKKDGTAVFDIAPQATVITVGGNDMDQEAAKPVSETRDKYNKLVEYKSDQPDGFMAPEIRKLILSGSEVIFSEKAVKPGDSWETELDNPALPAKKFKVKTTYVGSDKLEGAEVLKLKQTFTTETSKEGDKVTVEATFLLDATTFETLQVDGTSKDLPTQIGPLTMTMKTTKVTKK
ncbi:MAG: hypothetical protein ABJA67_03980 [Chthonomonadales bacterium]